MSSFGSYVRLSTVVVVVIVVVVVVDVVVDICTEVEVIFHPFLGKEIDNIKDEKNPK